jgi:hypothetical protein
MLLELKDKRNYYLFDMALRVARHQLLPQRTTHPVTNVPAYPTACTRGTPRGVTLLTGPGASDARLWRYIE